MRITKERVEQLIELHDINTEELIGGSKISDDEFNEWLQGNMELPPEKEKEIFERAKNIDLEERDAVRQETKKRHKLTVLMEGVDISRGWFSMWINGRRNIPYEKEKKIYENFDGLK